MRTVAALYIDPRGPYPKMEGVDCWDAERDARLYEGPHAVVAHPPCGPWGKTRHMYRGEEHDCAPRAVEQVRKFGGVLEQPAGSRLWDTCLLPRPSPNIVDSFGGYSVELDQSDWGHVARKPTWLYLVRVPALLANVHPRGFAAPPFLGRAPTHWCSGGRTKRPGMGATVPPGIKVCSAQQRRRTPPAFAEWLVELARSVQR